MAYDDLSAATIVYHTAYRAFISRYGEDKAWRLDFSSIANCPFALFNEVEYSDSYPSCHYIGSEHVPEDLLQKMTDSGISPYPSCCNIRSLTRGESYVVLFVGSEEDHQSTITRLLKRGTYVAVYYVNKSKMPKLQHPNYQSYMFKNDGTYTYIETVAPDRR